MARCGKTDGRLCPVTREDLRPGAVLRMVALCDGSAAAFSDCVVIEVSEKRDLVSFARPYVFLSLGTVLSGVERFQTSLASVLRDDGQFRAVVQSTGDVADCTM